MIQSYSVWDGFLRNADANGSKIAFDFGETRLTHRDVVDGGRRLAAGLATIGIASGDRIAVICDGRTEFFLILAAAARLGAILVPLNWRLNPGEIAGIFDDCKPKLTLVEPQYRHLAERASYHGAIVEMPSKDEGYDNAFADLIADEPLAGDFEGASETPFLILYTASTDGQPHGATISHGNLIASSVQMQLALQFDDSDCFLGVLPYCHMMAIALTMGVNFAGGRTIVRPRFEASQAAGLVEEHRVTLLGTFPPMLSSLLEAAEQEARDFRSLRFVMGLDAPPTIERLETSWPETVFWSIYGQTETSGNVTYGRWRDRPKAAGRRAALSKIAIVDEDDRPRPTGEVGEIVVRGPGVFQGYWGREAENAIIRRAGWHHTGDLGRFDVEGYLWYHGRAPHKELIKPGGENVYPGEVEQVLREHRAIRHAVVIGVPDEQWGEAVMAICQLSEEGAKPDVDALRAFVGARLARYKRPKHFVFVETMPMTPQGVPDRAAVKQSHTPTQ